MTRDDQIKEAAIRRYGNNGNESQYMLGKIQAFMVGARYADKNPNGSQIKWQTGEPKENGEYLVTLEDGPVCRDEWRELYCEDDIKCWVYNEGEVIAWCKLSNIEPYKENIND